MSYLSTTFQHAAGLVHLLHGGLFVELLVLVELRKLLVIRSLGALIVVNGETELDKAVDAVGEGGRLVEREARGEEGGVVEQPDQVLDGLVALVSLGLLAQRGNDR